MRVSEYTYYISCFFIMYYFKYSLELSQFFQKKQVRRDLGMMTVVLFEMVFLALKFLKVLNFLSQHSGFMQNLHINAKNTID